MEYNASAVPARFIGIVKCLSINLTNFTEEQAAERVVEEIRSLIEDVGITMKNFIVSKEMLYDLAGAAITFKRLLKNNPRLITCEDALIIYEKALL